MSDVSNAPASAPAPAPAQTEVPVSSNPTSTPNPVGSQAPDKPVNEANIEGQKGRPQSRREIIQEAYKRAVEASESGRPKPAEKQAAKPAEAKAGHNRPPDAEKPADKPAAKQADKSAGEPSRPAQPRGERGQFAPRTPSEGGASPNTTPRPAAEEGREPPAADKGVAPQAKQLPPTAPYREPPQRMSEQAKADWADVPETVRGDMHRMHEEFSRAYQVYRGDHEVMNSLRPFQQMAQQQGTSLAAAMNNYVGIEQKLRQDPISGLDRIVQNLGMKNAEGGPLTLRDIAYHVLSVAPDQLAQAQNNNAQEAANRQIAALNQELMGLKNHLQQMHNQQRYQYTRAQIDHFADTHPRFDELATIIHQEVAAGYSLEDAYRRADLLNPAPQAAQTRTQSAQTRDSDRSISGAPAAPALTSGPRRGSPEKPVGRREALENAVRRVKGAL